MIVDRAVTLKFVEGTFEQGFLVTLKIGAGAQPMTELEGRLPPNPELQQTYQHWRAAYLTLGQRLRLSAKTDQITNISRVEACQTWAEVLRGQLNRWLQSDSFRAVREKWLEVLSPAERISVILQAQDLSLQRLPWHLWELIERYPKAEVALSLPSYEQRLVEANVGPAVRILAILGSAQGLDVEADRLLLSTLPNAAVTLLVEPTREILNDQLWQKRWDILFFAGHSSTADDSPLGEFGLNATERITIAQLRYGLQTAISNGLQLAIFNSCDGLGLAQGLAALHLPNLIVMREPVPDQVAQTFLKYFLLEFAAGEPLYLSVRNARERLQGLEGEFPCATWLPVLFQNPAYRPVDWLRLYYASGAATQPRSTQICGRRLAATCLKSFAVAIVVSGLRFAGLLQPLELSTLGWMQRSRPEEGRDPRIVVITIDDADLQAQPPGQGSLSDLALKQLLETLEPYRPSAVGLDIYRGPVAVALPQLKARMQRSETLIATCKVSDPDNNASGVAPPPEVPPERVGFSDFIEDSDGILRRQILFMTPDPASACKAPYALSTQLAFRYLAAHGIEPQFTQDHDLQLGSVVFHRLGSRFGGYQTIDARGNQILLNYRAAHRVAAQVSLTDVLQGRFDLNAIRNQVVLIGVTAQGAGDYWATPFGKSAFEKSAGVLVQAQMTSQILSAVLDRRPKIWALPIWGDGLLILSAAGITGILCVRLQRSWQVIVGSSLCAIGLGGLCVAAFAQGAWLPCIPVGLAALGSGGLSALRWPFLKD